MFARTINAYLDRDAVATPIAPTDINASAIPVFNADRTLTAQQDTIASITDVYENLFLVQTSILNANLDGIRYNDVIQDTIFADAMVRNGIW